MKKSHLESEAYKRVKLYEETFSTESGKAVLKDLRRLFYDTEIYIPGDPYGTAFTLGQRSVVMLIRDMLRNSKHPELFEEVLDEYEL